MRTTVLIAFARVGRRICSDQMRKGYCAPDPTFVPWQPTRIRRQMALAGLGQTHVYAIGRRAYLCKIRARIMSPGKMSISCNVARPPLRRLWLTTALMLLFIGAMPSEAQMGAGPMGNAQIGGGHGGRHRNQQQTPQQNAAPEPPPVAPEPWPRLDIGAILCKSHDDLVAYQMQETPDPNDAAPHRQPNCSIVQKRTGIQILDRDGPSRTHVVSAGDTKQTGWTNAYLPSTPPTTVATAPGGRR
jgi:hypothetical protein